MFLFRFIRNGLRSTPFLFGPLLGSLAAVFIYLVWAWSAYHQALAGKEFNRTVEEYASLETPVASVRTTSHFIKSGSTLAQSLKEAGFSSPEVHDLVRTAKTVKDLNRIPSKLAYNIHWQDYPETQAVQADFLFNSSQTLRMTRLDQENWAAVWLDTPIEKTTESFTGVVTTSLWESAETAGMDPQLIVDLATIFAWQVDFNREVQPEDRWRIVVEKLFVKGKHIGWGNILAAEYKSHQELHTAVRFPAEGPGGAYYSPDGASLKRMFLKSPIKFGRISSKFKSARFHPILKRSIPHNGVDYAAPVGTPIMSVGKGTVEFAGRNGGSGIMVKIRHNGAYTTAYLHLSRIANGVRKGHKLEQGEVLGFVGSTGLATGPHLHFAFYENGVFVDPLGKKFPSAEPVQPQDMTMFSLLVTKVLKFLPSWSVAEEQSFANEST